MKKTSQFLKHRALPALLFSVSALLTSCSKDQEAMPLNNPTAINNPTAKNHKAYAFEYNSPYSNGGPIVAGAGYDNPTYVYFDSGVPFYGLLRGHSELTDVCSVEFWQGTQLALVARHVAVAYADPRGSNDGRGSLAYNIPAQLNPGNYTLTLRTESDDRSLTVGTTGDPSTYTHSQSDNITVTRPTGRPILYSQGLTPLGTPLTGRYTTVPLNWITANFSGDNNLRAFAKSQVTGTLYQLTSADGSGGIHSNGASPGSFTNTGSTTAQLNESSQPPFLPAGNYLLFIDNFAVKYAGGDGFIVETQPGTVVVKSEAE